ncbi:MAG: glycosyltransferase [Alphaproteobacteria bacterium]|nr:MAG: glycosyltransferase [Alphaproteobacteria bacterium]
MIPIDTMGARHADYVTGVSEATKKRVPEVNEIIPNGVDLRLFTPANSDEKEKAPTLLFVGTRLGRKRGQWLGDLWTDQIKPKLPEGAVLWTVADEPIEGEGIVNHGRVSVEVLSGLFRKAWAFCMPSLYEGFGVPYIEAMASGTPAIASPNVGAMEVLGNSAYGVVAPDDKLASEILSVVTDDKRRESLRTAGLARAQEYDWQEVAARYEAIYYRLLKLPMDQVVIK